MKNKLLLIALTALLPLELCLAQGTREAVMQDPHKSGGLYYVYDYKSDPAMTPAPAGYSPFYISHFGRHGARYCRSEYSKVKNAFSRAAKEDALTLYGKQLYGEYRKYYKEMNPSKGNLTALGKDQHRTIAARMFRRFPEVFEGPTAVSAISTESNRVIMSMWSFLSTLQALDDNIDIDADASAKYASFLQPALESNPYYVKGMPAFSPATQKEIEDYFYATVDWEAIYGRLFKSPEYARGSLGIEPTDFIPNLQRIDADAQCLGSGEGCFAGLLTPEENYTVWKTGSARNFAMLANYRNSGGLLPDYAAFTLSNIIESADADIASGDTRLRLRFGHDSGLMPLVAFLNVNGFGKECSTLDEGVETFPNYNSPMGASLQLVFYRNDSGKVLVKVLYNEKEASLPLAAVEGPYYDWNEFKDFYRPRIEASRKKIADVKKLREYKWKWEKTGKGDIETAAASIKVFGSRQFISMVRFPVKGHSLTVVESDGKKSAVTSKIASRNRAAAAINGSYFNTTTLLPVTLVKDNGKIVPSPTVGDQRRCNGMLRLRETGGRDLDVYRIQDTLACRGEVENWKEAIVAGPVLLDEGKPVEYTAASIGEKYYKKFYERRHPRTFLGYTADGMVYFVVVDGRFPGQAEGMSIRELQILSECLGLHESINLDGGGSSTLWTADRGVVNHPYDNKVFDNAGEREVPNIIMVR